MNRIAFKMQLKPGFSEEYQRRHAEIWPELKSLLRAEGIEDYSIFLDEETHTLFAVQKTGNVKGSQDLGKKEIVKIWWEYMADIMEVNEDNSPITTPLKEVFRMD